MERREPDLLGFGPLPGLRWPAAELYTVMTDLEAAVARPSGLADWRIEIEQALG